MLKVMTMDETNKNNQFPASPQSGWIKTGSPSSDNKQASSSSSLPKVIWILVGGGIILLLALFTGLLIAKKFTKKPSIYNQSQSSNEDCCSGTPECQQRHQDDTNHIWRCVVDNSSTCKSKSVCKPYDKGDPSACNGPQDCAAWEVCQDGHCRSKAGCSRDSDCVKGAKCVNGTCQGIDKGIECYADSQGVKIINKTGGKISGNVDWFASWCNNPKACGYCGGKPNHEYVTLEAGQVWTRGFTNSENKEKGICDWQTDLKATLGSYTCQTADTGCDHNCHVPPTSTPTPTPTPTVTPTSRPFPPTSCTQVKILKVNGQPYSLKTTLKPGDVLLLQGKGDTAINKTIDQLYFTIFKKGGTAVADAGEGTNLEYTISQNVKHYTALYQFTVPDYGVYSVSLAVHSPEDGWSCTN